MYYRQISEMDVLGPGLFYFKADIEDINSLWINFETGSIKLAACASYGKLEIRIVATVTMRCFI